MIGCRAKKWNRRQNSRQTKDLRQRNINKNSRHKMSRSQSDTPPLIRSYDSLGMLGGKWPDLCWFSQLAVVAAFAPKSVCFSIKIGAKMRRNSRSANISSYLFTWDLLFYAISCHPIVVIKISTFSTTRKRNKLLDGPKGLTNTRTSSAGEQRNPPCMHAQRLRFSFFLLFGSRFARVTFMTCYLEQAS